MRMESTCCCGSWASLLVVLGAYQARAPLARYRALQATEANLRR
ncbi:MAG: hypothetical protein R3C32_11780 [Chloroflexota bacterium]